MKKNAITVYIFDNKIAKQNGHDSWWSIIYKYLMRELHLFISFLFIRGRSQRQQSEAQTLSTHTPPALPGESRGVPRPGQRSNRYSVSWVSPWASFQWNVPGTSLQGGDQETSSNFSCSFWCEGAVARPRAPHKTLWHLSSSTWGKDSPPTLRGQTTFFSWERGLRFAECHPSCPTLTNCPSARWRA